VNARASIATPLGAQPVSHGRAEHISLEADVEPAAPARAPYRKVRAKYALHSSLRRCTTELALLDDHFLQVHATRARKAPLKYAVDLRFLNSQPVRVRHIAWPWIAAGAVFAAGTAIAVWTATTRPTLLLPMVIAAGGGLLALAAAIFLAVRDTHETLSFTTVHGAAKAVDVIGGLGSTKHGKAFFVSMIKEIAAAKQARPQPKQQWLRDEMREHHRLRELGVLSEAEYEASKARILQAHD
jgi:hypothetical protein